MADAATPTSAMDNHIVTKLQEKIEQFILLKMKEEKNDSSSTQASLNYGSLLEPDQRYIFNPVHPAPFI